MSQYNIHISVLRLVLILVFLLLSQIYDRPLIICEGAQVLGFRGSEQRTYTPVARFDTAAFLYPQHMRCGLAKPAADLLAKMLAQNHRAPVCLPMTLLIICAQDKKAAKALKTEMKEADTNQDGMISFIEFLGYFQKMARYRADLARTQRLEAYGQPLDLPPSKHLATQPLCLPCASYMPPMCLPCFVTLWETYGQPLDWECLPVSTPLLSPCASHIL